MTMFNIGDRVEYTHANPLYGKYNGESGIVVAIVHDQEDVFNEVDDCYFIQWDDPEFVHKLDALGSEPIFDKPFFSTVLKLGKSKSYTPEQTGDTDDDV